MKPRNFPGRIKRRQLRAEQPKFGKTEHNTSEERMIRTKRDRRQPSWSTG